MAKGLISSEEMCFAISHYHTASIRTATLETVILFINAFISIFGSAANILIIISYFHNRQLQTIQNFIFLLLAATDLIVTGLVQPLFIIGTLSAILGLQDCLFSDLRILISFFCIGLSIQTITILSLQSFIFLAFPYRCQRMMTKFRLKIAVGTCWVVVLFITIVAAVVGPVIIVGGGLVIITISLFIVTLTWVWTYRLVCRHRKTIWAQQTPPSSRSVRSQKVCRSAFTAFIIIVSLLISYLPAIAVLTYRAESLSSAKMEKYRYLLYQRVGFTFLYANSLVNPCLVFWRSSVFRDTAVKLCCNSST